MGKYEARDRVIRLAEELHDVTIFAEADDDRHWNEIAETIKQLSSYATDIAATD